jgi:uncharacterized protein YbjQ (UPF0145 family)
LLSAADAAALRSVGLVPLRQVYGVSVYHVGFTGTAYCGGAETNRLKGERWRASRTAGEWSGYGAAVASLRNVRRRALERMVRDARELEADGVVGADLVITPYPGAGRTLECSVAGVAVRAVGDVRPKSPFVSTLSGVDTAKLFLHGWVPVGVALGVAVEIEHDDAATRAVTGWRGVAASNAEVPAVTRLVQRTRTEARRTLDGEVDRLGADGAVVSSMALAVNETECHVYEGLHDHVAEAVTVATAIAEVDGRTPPKPRPVISAAPWPRTSHIERPAPLQPEWLE